MSYKELADIAESKINPDFAATNYQQQAGFSAEVKNVARTNAENIINQNNTRIARTDNVGAVNHSQFDFVLVDKNNVPILDSNGQYLGGTQQKNFNSVKNYDKLLIREYDHYKDAKIAVPPDQYDEIIAHWNGKIQDLSQQSSYLRGRGEDAQANDIDAKIAKIKDVKSRTVASKVSTKDAMEARKSPLKSTVKDIGRVAHRAGIASMKTGIAVEGSLAAAKNLYAVNRGDKSGKEAIVDVATDVGKAATYSYARGVTNAAVGGALRSTSNQILKNLSKGNGPTAVVNTGIILAKSTMSLISGNISPEEYVKNIGREGTTLAASMTGANLGAVVGTCIFPGVGSIVGGVIGGMIASMLSGSMYCALQKSIIR
ncbi:MAG: hypothetical protein AB7F40_04980 [Victivallaceae bacterium]